MIIENSVPHIKNSTAIWMPFEENTLALTKSIPSGVGFTNTGDNDDIGANGDGKYTPVNIFNNFEQNGLILDSKFSNNPNSMFLFMCTLEKSTLFSGADFKLSMIDFIPGDNITAISLEEATVSFTYVNFIDSGLNIDTKLFVPDAPTFNGRATYLIMVTESNVTFYHINSTGVFEEKTFVNESGKTPVLSISNLDLIGTISNLLSVSVKNHDLPDDYVLRAKNMIEYAHFKNQTLNLFD